MFCLVLRFAYSTGDRSVVKNILDSLDEESILNRIKAELKAKLGQNRENT